ncbi:methanogenesis marker 17 protein [Methanoplanus endosymbiosus]|uniref:Methanogenesis marker 17 protein n=1 Tax=Methanoplanus endosymbiosus TaxID=33865 RepID=A0A9E7PNS7_9EURY|nr:methanogenesis marker 17 protein [Methanoplanus endosymbiosus]UUX92717.1 methanogenesis marker 17 protein [Methanoplanus endosymbiosus]
MALDYFQVECVEEKGRKAYEEIAGDILMDLNLLQIISRFYIKIDPEFPLFIASGEIRKMPGKVRAGDFTGILNDEGKITIEIGDETYLSFLLEKLWDLYGRENVIQPDRFTITIDASIAGVEEIKNLAVFDAGTGVYKDIIYAMQWIAPEGFKVRRECTKGSRFYYIASENILTDDVAEKEISEAFDKLEG